MRVLLLSAYDADSHRRWHQGLRSMLVDYEWTILTLPARYFSWRIRGNSLTWSVTHREVLERDYDLLIVTSMTDLSALRGFVPHLASIATLVYFHENQFAYPSSDKAHDSVEPQILNLYSALCANRLVFNTEFNRRSFLTGATQLLKRLPDHVPKGIVERLQELARVVPVPIEDHCYELAALPLDERQRLWSTTEQPQTIKILWAARWEYDKGPQLLMAILDQLRERGVSFKLCLLGQQFRRSPPEFEDIKRQLGPQLVQFGFEADAQRYRQWLASADIVLSTALHEFQGLAVLEAIAAGCNPVLPNRLSYPEIVDAPYLYDVSSDSLVEQAVCAVECLLRVVDGAGGRRGLVDASRWSWSSQRPVYQALIESCSTLA